MSDRRRNPHRNCHRLAAFSKKFRSLNNNQFPLHSCRFWKGGESLPARAGRGKSEHRRARRRVTFCNFKFEIAEGYTRAENRKVFRRKVPQKIKPPAVVLTSFGVARVKRWCKRPPREAQATRHGKPRRVQGQIGNPGAARSAFRESETGFGYRSPRQMILSAARRRQNSAYSPSKTIFVF